MENLLYEDVYKVTVEVMKELMSKSFYYHKKELPEITPQSRLKEDLHIDSLDRVDFLLLIEDVYKVELIKSSYLLKKLISLVDRTYYGSLNL